MASAARRRARIMAKARKHGYGSLSQAEINLLTPGQRDKIGLGATYDGPYYDPPSDTNVPAGEQGKVVQTPEGPRIVPINDPRPDLYPATGGGGDDGNKRPAFTTGYTPDSIYNDTLASIAARRQMALNAATEGERGLSNDYGLGINQDASGATYTGQWAASDQNQLGIDPSNPFSRASLLNKSYFVAGKVGEGSYANRGLLTSGAYQRNQNRDAFRFEGGKDSLLKSFASQLQDYRQRRAQADADARSGQQQASYDLFNRRRDEYDRMYPS